MTVILLLKRLGVAWDIQQVLISESSNKYTHTQAYAHMHTLTHTCAPKNSKQNPGSPPPHMRKVCLVMSALKTEEDAQAKDDQLLRSRRWIFSRTSQRSTVQLASWFLPSQNPVGVLKSITVINKFTYLCWMKLTWGDLQLHTPKASLWVKVHSFRASSHWDVVSKARGRWRIRQGYRRERQELTDIRTGGQSQPEPCALTKRKL